MYGSKYRNPGPRLFGYMIPGPANSPPCYISMTGKRTME